MVTAAVPACSASLTGTGSNSTGAATRDRYGGRTKRPSEMAEMTSLEAIQARHSVRKNKDEPIPEDILAILRIRALEVYK